MVTISLAYILIIQKSTKINGDITHRQLQFSIFDYEQLALFHFNFATTRLPYLVPTYSPVSPSRNPIIRYIEQGPLRNDLLILQ